MKSQVCVSIDRELLRCSRAVAFAARRTLASQIELWIEERLALSAPEPDSDEVRTLKADIDAKLLRLAELTTRSSAESEVRNAE